MDDGHIFDCVDINKQPAFDHPLLKDHKVQMQPSSYPRGMVHETSSTDSILHIGLKDGGCPQGAVPIKRIGMKDLLWTKSFSRHISSYPTRNGTLDSVLNKIKHGISLKTFLGQFYGAAAHINVWGLAQVLDKQSSTSEIWVANHGGPKVTTVVEAGWIVSPKVFGDSKTRLYTFWTNDTYKTGGCVNTLCPGFVQVSSDIPLGIDIHPLSVYNGSQYVIHILIFKDQKTNNWWLAFGPGKKTLGYWPSAIVPRLSAYATDLAFGGVVTYPRSDLGPPMGSGHYPDEGERRASYFKNVQMVDSDNKLKPLGAKEVSAYSTKPECYKIGPYSENEFMFLYGSSGGCYG